ncbi:MAG: ThiF family adenylyltransferase [Halobacteria archaeon]
MAGRGGRYDRLRALAGYDRERLASSTFLVAGVGALGNEVAKDLALLGAGRLLLVDFDRVEPSNLSRSLLFREADVGLPKVRAAARALRNINPGAEVEAVEGDLRWDLGLGTLRRCAVAFGCLDNREARLALNRMCRSAGVPWVNGGLDGWDGVVELYPPRGACYECSFTGADYAAVAERYSCPARPPAAGGVPTAPTAAAIVGGMAVEAGLFALPREAEALYYRGGEVVRSRLQRRPGCPAHHAPGPVKRSGLTPESRVRELLAAHPGTLFLDREVVTALRCLCGRGRRLRVPRLRMDGALRCRCGREMASETVRRVGTGDPLAERSLKELGIPPGHIVEVARGNRSVFVELKEGRRG